ncbi:MAG: EamA family transporter, partial [Elsteraceae bacterium]
MPSRKLALLLAVGALLGSSANITKLGLLAGWTPVAFLFWSMLGAGVCLMALAVAAGVKPRFNREGLLYALISGLISIAAPNLLGYAAIPHVGAGFVALSFAFPAILTYAMALSLRMETFAVVRAGGLLCGFLGIVTLALTKPQNAVSISPWAFAALAAPLFLAMGNIYRTRRWPADAAPLSLAPGMLLAGAALVSVFAALFGFSIGAPTLGAGAG